MLNIECLIARQSSITFFLIHPVYFSNFLVRMRIRLQLLANQNWHSNGCYQSLAYAPGSGYENVFRYNIVVSRACAATHKNIPLLEIPTTQFSTTIRELNWNKVIIFACCWPDSWVDRSRDRNYKIFKFKNTYTLDNKQLFQITGQIHGAMLLNIDLFILSCCY